MMMIRRALFQCHIVAIAPSGGIWVRRSTLGDEPAQIDVFAADGAYVGTLPIGTPWPAAFLTGGKIAAIEVDEFDIERVVVYGVEGSQ